MVAPWRKRATSTDSESERDIDSKVRNGGTSVLPEVDEEQGWEEVVVLADEGAAPEGG